jgi:ATP-dependent Lon protease
LNDSRVKSKIPIFPLGVVLFPGMPLPLHIFEERYKQMIRECLEANHEFGVVYYAGEDFFQIGCTAQITKVLRSYDDGRMDLLTLGARRFRIVKIRNEKPYLTADIDYFDDDEAPTLATVQSDAVSLFKEALRLSGREKGIGSFEELTPKELSFIIAGGAGFTLPEKQAFLEMTSTEERLRKAGSALKQLLERLQTTKEIESIISGNGHLHNRRLNE